MKIKSGRKILIIVLCLVILLSLTSCTYFLNGTYKNGDTFEYEVYRFNGNKFRYEHSAIWMSEKKYDGTYKIENGEICFMYDDREYCASFEKGRDYIIIDGTSFDKQ